MARCKQKNRERKLLPGSWKKYGQLSMKQRRSAWISLNWKIKKFSKKTSGVLSSFNGIEEPGRPAMYNQQHHGYFLGGDGVTIFNGWFHTASDEFWSQIECASMSASRSALSEEEIVERYADAGEPDAWIKRLMDPPPTYDNLGGLTFGQYAEQWATKEINDHPPVILESFKLDHGFEYGVGVRFVIDTPSLTREVILNAIARFRVSGEINWCAATPVTRSALPVLTRMNTLKLDPEVIAYKLRDRSC